MRAHKLTLPLSQHGFFGRCIVGLVFIAWYCDVDLISAQSNAIRFATYNISLNRELAGALISELQSGNSKQAQHIAEVIQRVRPDVILLNEIDFDPRSKSVQLFCEKYLAVPQNGQQAIEYDSTFVAPVNTGIPSGLDLNGDGKTGTSSDAYGFGAFPGQFGMAVLSKHPIDKEDARTFQRFLWKDMPAALLPVNPQTKRPYYGDGVLAKFRLSSKSHWDVPIRIGDRTVHFICAHPTPPVFDGPEDRNGKRNHDEIRLIADYISGGDRSNYIYDDRGGRGGLSEQAAFVIAGDMNADPRDGDSTAGAARLLIKHPLIRTTPVPRSDGARRAAQASGRANVNHRGDPAHDTADFSDDTVGNLRVDYVLPSKGLRIVDSGVFWPNRESAMHVVNSASDHHLVWIDIVFGNRP